MNKFESIFELSTSNIRFHETQIRLSHGFIWNSIQLKTKILRTDFLNKRLFWIGCELFSYLGLCRKCFSHITNFQNENQSRISSYNFSLTQISHGQIFACLLENIYTKNNQFIWQSEALSKQFPLLSLKIHPKHFSPSKTPKSSQNRIFIFSTCLLLWIFVWLISFQKKGHKSILGSLYASNLLTKRSRNL